MSISSSQSILTLYEICVNNPSNQYANNIALIDAQDPTVKLTYTQFKKNIQILAIQLNNILNTNNNHPKIISISSVNCIEYVLAFLTITALGYTAAPLNPNFTLNENTEYLLDLQAEAVIILKPTNNENKNNNNNVINAATKSNIKVIEIFSSSGAEEYGFSLLNQQHSASHKGNQLNLNPSPEAVALILHTSGTTSKPKSVPLTQKNLAVNIGNIIRTYNVSPKDKTLLVMPLFHVHGLIGVLFSTLASGGTVVIPTKFSASTFFNQLKQFQITWYSSVPTIHQIIVSNKAKLLNHSSGNNSKPFPQLRFVRSCSAALAPSILYQVEELFGVLVLEAYAMTEASHQCASNPLNKRKPGSVGIAQGVEIKIFNEKGEVLNTGVEGEVCVSGLNIMSGYKNNPQANQTSFWPNPNNKSCPFFRTGDLGKLDSERYLFLTGRSKELINRSGEKISPLEIDEVLLQSSLVDQAISFPLPHSTYGQEVYAAVVLKPSVNNENKNQIVKTIQKHCESKLSLFKVPKYVFIATELPKTSTGKIQRRFVAQAFEKDLPKELQDKTINTKTTQKLKSKL